MSVVPRLAKGHEVQGANCPDHGKDLEDAAERDPALDLRVRLAEQELQTDAREEEALEGKLEEADEDVDCGVREAKETRDERLHGVLSFNDDASHGDAM